MAFDWGKLEKVIENSKVIERPPNSFTVNDYMEKYALRSRGSTCAKIQQLVKEGVLLDVTPVGSNHNALRYYTINNNDLRR